MVDTEYARGWDDCLEAVTMVLAKAQNLKDVEKNIKKLHELVKEKKFEKIKHELGAFEIF